MNRHSKHIFHLFTTFALAASLICSISAETTQENCATVSIAAGMTDFPKLALDLTLYQRDETNTFAQLKEMELITSVNRVSKDVEIHITPEMDGVSIRVDYLTDLDGDNCYELLDSESIPAHDMVTSSGTLVSASGDTMDTLEVGTSYTLTGQELISRGTQAFSDRGRQYSPHYLPDLTPQQLNDYALIYMITVSCEGQEDLCYYLQIFEQVPSISTSEFLDVDADAWYYQAVDYVTSNGLVPPTSRTTFAPEETTTRSMVAESLYCIAGKPTVSPLSFEDVSSQTELVNAVSWAAQSGFMSNTDTTHFSPDNPMTRQEVALVLYQYVKAQGVDTRNWTDLYVYEDSSSIAEWAKPAMQWAISAGLLNGHGTHQAQIDPTGTLTRAEFSDIIRVLHSSVLK